MYDENVPTITLDEIKSRRFLEPDESAPVCHVCEHGPEGYVCDKCCMVYDHVHTTVLDDIAAQCSFGHPDHAGVECFVIVIDFDQNHLVWFFLRDHDLKTQTSCFDLNGIFSMGTTDFNKFIKFFRGDIEMNN